MSDAPQLVVMGRATAEGYRPRAGDVCISITTPGDTPARLSDRFADVLRLSFADVPWSDRPELVEAHGIQAHDVARIVAFVRRHQGTARRLVIHCTVGASRSVGMAQAIRSALLAEDIACPTILRRRSDGNYENIGPVIRNRPLFVRIARALREDAAVTAGEAERHG